MSNDNNKSKVLFLAQGAIIAALYVAFTMIAAGFDLASGAIQVRFSECLTVMPFFTTAGIPGVTIGCLLANIVIGSSPIDIVFGTLATLIGAVGTYLLRKNRYLCTIPPVLSNMIIIPFVLKYAYGAEGTLVFFALTVAAGEIITCIILGQILISALLPLRGRLFSGGNDSVKKSKK